jgi:hypothetical protein
MIAHALNIRFASSSDEEGNDEQYQEDKEQHFCDSGCGMNDTHETEHSSDQSDYEKHQPIFQHKEQPALLALFARIW